MLAAVDCCCCVLFSYFNFDAKKVVAGWFGYLGHFMRAISSIYTEHTHTLFQICVVCTMSLWCRLLMRHWRRVGHITTSSHKIDAHAYWWWWLRFYYILHCFSSSSSDFFQINYMVQTHHKLGLQMVFRMFKRRKKISQKKVLNGRTDINDVRFGIRNGIQMVNNNGPKLTSMRFVQLTHNWFMIQWFYGDFNDNIYDERLFIAVQ